MRRAEITPAFAPIWEAEGGFEGLWRIEGELFKRVKERRTLRFVRAGRSFFIKIHAGVGWGEIWKNLLTLRLPVLGAKNEYEAILHLTRAGIDVPKLAAFAQQGRNPARLRSFVVTEDVGESTSLEHYCKNWPASPSAFAEKRRLIEEVADIARRMHGSGANHRDFYLPHFLRRRDGGKLCLIDLHRVQLRAKVPRRWLVKDLAGLYFSAMDIGLTRRDVLRFLRGYRAASLREIFARETNLWKEIEDKARRMHAEFKARN